MDELRGAVSPTVEDLMIYDRIFKTSLKCKCFGLIFCITGTVLLLLLGYDFFDSNVMSIVLPGFLSGYMFVNIAGILTACRGHVDLIADIFFSAFGVVANSCCGIYLFYYWIDWVVNTIETGGGIEGTMYLVLSMTCILNGAAMGGQLVSSILEMKRRGVSVARDGGQ